MRGLRVGIDTGGTFTDFVLADGAGRLRSFKLRSNPSDPAAVILEGLGMAADGESAEVTHGSTVATNALLERKGSRTAFLTTKGFEDILEIGRQRRTRLYRLSPVPAAALVDRSFCFGIRERTYHDGTRARRPARSELHRLRQRLRRAGVESVAICLLHSYRNDANERAVAEALTGLGYLCCSHEVSPEYREYERSSTTVINAYVGPLMDGYLRKLEAASPRISILQSNGGSISMAEARRHAVRTVLSGPAGGVVGAVEMARLSGHERVMGFDMGGTSTDVSLSDGAPRESAESSVGGFPIRVPMLDIQTVGAGGGSLARVDAGGLLRVGPESAGADPGPACYGTGTRATVTDAHVVLGRICSEQFLGGRMTIDQTRSETAVSAIAADLDLRLEQAASGILSVANANMQQAIRAISVERGHDPKRFTLVAFGGCGGLHACEVAEALAVRSVLVPNNAGVLSALGMLLADRVRDYAAGVLGRSDFHFVFEKLESVARRENPGAALIRSADLRYEGQSYELNVGWDPAEPSRPFHQEHKRTYGYSSPGKPVEVVTLRLRARQQIRRPRLEFTRDRGAGVSARRRVFTGGRWRRALLTPRAAVSFRWQPGPALILDYGSTTLVPAGWRYRVDKAGNIEARRS